MKVYGLLHIQYNIVISETYLFRYLNITRGIPCSVSFIVLDDPLFGIEKLRETKTLDEVPLLLQVEVQLCRCIVLLL